MADKEETLRRGFGLHPVRVSMSRRCNNHDYSKSGWYMVTLVAEGRRSLFGVLQHHPEPHVDFSPLGNEIISGVQYQIPQHVHEASVRKICVMPDHIHIIIQFVHDLPTGWNLGRIMKGFKVGVLRAYRELVGAYKGGLFEDNYNDRILHNGERQFAAWCRYLDDNPRRLSIKRLHPDYFTVLHHIRIAGQECEIVGNRFLMDIPDRSAVVVHRVTTASEFETQKAQWLDIGQRGGVLVSAAIASREKIVLHEAMERGWNIIWIRDNGFPPLYKPAGRSFDACAAGRLLQIAPCGYNQRKKTITREECLRLNALAEAIAHKDSASEGS